MKIFGSFLLVSSICLMTAFAQSSFMSQATISPSEVEMIAIEWYPNPVRVGDKIKVDVSLEMEADLRTELLDALGRKVFDLKASYPEGQSRIHLYTNDLQPGLYFIRVSNERGAARTEKIVIE